MKPKGQNWHHDSLLVFLFAFADTSDYAKATGGFNIPLKFKGFRLEFQRIVPGCGSLVTVEQSGTLFAQSPRKASVGVSVD